MMMNDDDLMIKIELMNVNRNLLTAYMTRVLVKQHSEADRKNITRFLAKKLNVILKDMLDVCVSTLPHSHFADDETVKVVQSLSYRDKWGQITLGRNRPYANAVLMPLLCEVVREGTTGVSTAVRIREITMDALMELAIEETDNVVWKARYDFTGLAVMETPVNVQSLKQYLTKCENELRHADSNHRVKLLRNISLSKSILTSLENNVLIQEATIADSGRCYLKGLNLQTAPKELRHAALGHCHLYDMRVGSFAVMAAVAKDYAARELQQDFEFHNIKAYIKNKEQFRMRVTQLVYPEETKGMTTLEQVKGFYGFYNVKGALTAIGFGAKRNVNAVWKDHNNSWQKTSLLKAFKGNKEPTQRFLDCTLAKGLIDEYVECGKIILQRVKTDEVFAASFHIAEDMNDSQILAMVYQSMETLVLNNFMELAGADNVLLPVHDGAYFRHKLNYSNIHGQLSVPYIGDMSYIQFDHTAYGVNTIDTGIDAHNATIQEQEAIANKHSSTFSTTSDDITAGNRKQVMTAWGLVDAEFIDDAQPAIQQEQYFKGPYN